MTLFILSACFYSQASEGQNVTPMEVGAERKPNIDLKPYLYYRDPLDGTLIPFSTISKSLHFNQKHLFLIKLKNTTTDSIFRYVQFGEHYVTVVNILIQSEKNASTVSLPGPENAIPLVIAPKEEITLSFTYKELNRVNPDKLTITLVSGQHLKEDMHRLEIAQSFFLGLFAFLCFFNLIGYVVTRMAVHIKYAIYIFCSLLYFLYYYGFLQRVFPDINTISINLVSTWYYLVFITYFIFLNEFGQYKQYSPWGYRLLKIGIINKCIQLLYESVFNILGAEFIYSVWYKNTILYGEIVLMCFIIYFILKNKNVRGRIVIIASMLLTAGAILGQLEFEGTLRGYFVEIGIAAELLAFSVGLGYISKLNHIEKEHTQQLYIEQLMKNEKNQQTLNEQLEEKIKERTWSLEKKNEENILLLREIHHRVKNNLQIISSFINIQLRKLGNSAGKYFLLDLSNKILAMGLVHEKLYRKTEIGIVDTDSYLQELADKVIASLSEPSLVIQFRYSPSTGETIPLEQAMTLGLIQNELLFNSMKHARKSPQHELKIECGLQRENGNLRYFLEDNGQGPADTSGFKLPFIEQLARKINGTICYGFQNGLRVEMDFPSPVQPCLSPS